MCSLVIKLMLDPLLLERMNGNVILPEHLLFAQDTHTVCTKVKCLCGRLLV